MILIQKLLGICTALFLLLFVVFIMKNYKLRVEYSWPWMLIAISMLGLVLFYEEISKRIIFIFGIENPLLFYFYIAIILLLILNMVLYLKLSKKENELKNLAQQFSITQLKVEENSKKLNVE